MCSEFLSCHEFVNHTQICTHTKLNLAGMQLRWVSTLQDSISRDDPCKGVYCPFHRFKARRGYVPPCQNFLNSYSRHEENARAVQLSRVLSKTEKMKILCLHGNGTNTEVSFSVVVGLCQGTTRIAYCGLVG